MSDRAPKDAGTGNGRALSRDVLLALGQEALDRGEHRSALEWFRAGARGGDPRAYNMLGRCHEFGWGTAADTRQAAGYYHHACEAGDAWAAFNLADLLMRGEGVERDEEAAFRCYSHAAEGGVGKALNMLALFYEEGRVVGRDAEAARQLYLAGAEGGDCWAQFNTARLLIARGAVDEALRWLERTLSTGFGDFWREVKTALEGQADARLAAFAERLPA